MSGLFTRLARQLRGEVPLLHAAARLPFHGAPPTLEWPEVDPAALPDAPAATSADALRPPAADAPPADAPGILAAMLPTARRLPAARTPEPPAAPTTASTGWAPPAAQPAHAAAPSPVDSPGDARRDDTLTGSERPPEAVAMGAPERTGAAGRSWPLPAAALRPAAAPGQAPALTAPSLPPPLMAPAGMAGPTATHAAAAPHGELRGPPVRRGGEHTLSSAPAPNEVHVHIGRIEVTALREAPARPAARKAGRAPMSLDEYLARRQKASP